MVVTRREYPYIALSHFDLRIRSRLASAFTNFINCASLPSPGSEDSRLSRSNALVASLSLSLSLSLCVCVGKTALAAGFKKPRRRLCRSERSRPFKARELRVNIVSRWPYLVDGSETSLGRPEWLQPPTVTKNNLHAAHNAAACRCRGARRRRLNSPSHARVNQADVGGLRAPPHRT